MRSRPTPLPPAATTHPRPHPARPPGARAPALRFPALSALPFLLSLLTLLLAGCAGTGRPGGPAAGGPADGHAFDRRGFGTSGLPFWMGLTPREVRALAGREKAAGGDAAALLDLAIFASGFPRDAAGYDAIHARVDAFARKARGEVERQRTIFAKGRALHDAMHKEFFAGAPGARSGSPESRGYDLEQSSLSAIFSTGRFNCISSALLYAVLSRRFGLDARGVLMPSHAFVQIGNPGAQAIEVETTSPAGYGLAHDREFYARRAAGWFRDRGLAVGTYDDYLKRRILTPLELVADNMSHQHTSPARMGAEDRCRLSEARAFLLPDHHDAQYNRLAVYQNEYVALARRKDFAAVAALHAVARPALADVSRRFPEDRELGIILGHVWHGHAHTFAMLGRRCGAVESLDSAWAIADRVPPEPAQRANLLAVAQYLAVEEAGAGRFAEAEAVLARYAGRAGGDAGHRKARAWLQGAWAADRWNRQDWEGALAHLERQLATGGADTAQVEKGMEGAYINGAIARHGSGDLEGARARLRACRDRLPKSAECAARLQRLMAGSP